MIHRENVGNPWDGGQLIINPIRHIVGTTIFPVNDATRMNLPVPGGAANGGAISGAIGATSTQGPAAPQR